MLKNVPFVLYAASGHMVIDGKKISVAVLDWIAVLLNLKRRKQILFAFNKPGPGINMLLIGKI